MAKNYKILVIEDEKTLVNLITSRLEKEGYKVFSALDGEDGLKMIIKKKPDLILLDIIMPKVNGYEVLEKMKEEGLSIPVIIISNSGQPVEIERTKELGAVDHLIKTQFDPSEVVEKVDRCLDKERAGSYSQIELKPREEEGARKLNLNILLVEDDPFLRDICGKKLAKEGYTIYEAVDGSEAIELARRVKPDIVLLDVILPTMDGFQVLKKIRSEKDETIKNVPIIMLSNLGQEDDIKRAMDLGANDYLVKAHFTTDEIADRINVMLKK